MVSDPNAGRRSGLLLGGLLGGGVITTILACVGIAAAFALCIGGFVFAIGSGIKSSEVYQTALETARADSDVTAALGAPIEDGWLVLGSLQTQGLSGTADLQVPLQGSKGSGTLFIGARRENGVWNYYTLAVEVDATGELIALNE
jgi:hypothetical protein